MHFKLDLKEVDEEKSGENGTFKKIRLLLCPFFLFVFGAGRFCRQHLWIDGGTAGKVANLECLQGTDTEAGIVPYFLLLGQSVVSGTFLFFWNKPRIRLLLFFDFLWLCLLYMNCCCPCHHCSLSQLDLLDLSQTKWWSPTVRCEQ